MHFIADKKSIKRSGFVTPIKRQTVNLQQLKARKVFTRYVQGVPFVK